MHIQFVNSTVDSVIYIANDFPKSHAQAGERVEKAGLCAGSRL